MQRATPCLRPVLVLSRSLQQQLFAHRMRARSWNFALDCFA